MVRLMELSQNLLSKLRIFKRLAKCRNQLIFLINIFEFRLLSSRDLRRTLGKSSFVPSANPQILLKNEKLCVVRAIIFLRPRRLASLQA